ncbi:MAG: hypothetical protein QM751_03390 [Paludibacteraceae bacterium]
MPIFIAANYTMTYYNEHNLCPKKVRLPIMTDTVVVNERIYFEQIAGVLNMSIEELRLLNPQYKRDIVPGDIKPYPIRLPMNFANQFIEKRTRYWHTNQTYTTIDGMKQPFRCQARLHNNQTVHPPEAVPHIK